MRSIIVLLSVLLMSVNLFAADRYEIRVLGAGNEVELDPSSIPAELRSGYLVMKKYCMSCHGEERIISTLRAGISPVTKQPYGDAEFRDKIIKIMRSSRADLDRSHAKELIDFFTIILHRARLV